MVGYKTGNSYEKAKRFFAISQRIINIATNKTVRSEAIGNHSTDDFTLINWVNGL